MEKASMYRNPTTPNSIGFSGMVSTPYVGNTSNSNADSTEALRKQNELLTEQNRLLQIIANKNVSISSRDIFDATQKEAVNYFNMNGDNPFVF